MFNGVVGKMWNAFEVVGGLFVKWRTEEPAEMKPVTEIEAVRLLRNHEIRDTRTGRRQFRQQAVALNLVEALEISGETKWASLWLSSTVDQVWDDN